MIVQNNPFPWVFLALIVLAGCLLLGMLLGSAEMFNPTRTEAEVQIRQTQEALGVIATQTAMSISETQQAPVRQQTLVAAQMTALPLQATATHVAGEHAFQAAQQSATQTAIAAEIQGVSIAVQATQTAMANDEYLQRQKAQATVTAMNNLQESERNGDIASLVIIGVGTTTLCGWILLRGLYHTLTARARDKEALAHLLAEQRRLTALRASVQSAKKKEMARHQYPLPTSLMQRPGDGNDMPPRV